MCLACVADPVLFVVGVARVFVADQRFDFRPVAQVSFDLHYRH